MRFSKFDQCILGGLLWVGTLIHAGTQTVGVATRDPAISIALGSSETRLDWLRREIARHDELYFKKAAPEISDAAYDALKRELVALERQQGARAASVGDDRDGRFPTRTHGEPMLSLDKAYSREELQVFLDRVRRAAGRHEASFVIEPKYDGVAISVVYEAGRLVRAVTRGNGIEGEDVTANVKAITGVPQVFAEADASAGNGRVPSSVEVRGELYIDRADFEELNRELEEDGRPVFATPRNLAAGTLKQKDPALLAHRKVRAVFYGYGKWETSDAESLPMSQRDCIERLRAWGLPVPDGSQFVRDERAVWAAVRLAGEKRTAWSFPTDGVVIKVDSRALQQSLGIGADAPRWALAYKFAAERAATRVREITLQVGRTGVLTPVAELAPVRLGGTTIGRATLHNVSEIARRDVRVGDTVYIERAGEVIPAIMGVDLEKRPPDAAPFVFPVACPSCGSALKQSAGEVALRCPAADCPAQLQKRIEHFVSADAMAIKGLGPALIAGLVREKRLSDVSGLFSLTREDLRAAGMKSRKISDSILSQLEQAKSGSLARFIHGLGLPQVGRVTADKIATKTGSLESLRTLSVEQLRSSGVAEAEAVIAYLNLPETVALFDRLEKQGVNPGAQRRGAGGGFFSGKTVVLTGVLENHSRAAAREKLEAAGATVSDTVTRKTDVVIAGAKAGEKLDDAKAAGVRIIDDREMVRLLAE